MIGPRHPAKRLFFPSHRMSIPSFQAMASMKTKSQLDVWGAPISTVGRAGAGSEASVQRLNAQNVRAMSPRSIRQQ
jgi:hypothetical protein